MTASSRGYKNGTIYLDSHVGIPTGMQEDPPYPTVLITFPDLDRLRGKSGQPGGAQWLWRLGIVLHLRGATFHRMVFCILRGLCPRAPGLDPVVSGRTRLRP